MIRLPWPKKPVPDTVTFKKNSESNDRAAENLPTPVEYVRRLKDSGAIEKLPTEYHERLIERIEEKVQRNLAHALGVPWHRLKESKGK